MDFFKNDLTDETLERFYKTYKLTLDTCDFVPNKTNKKIYKYINKNLKRAFKKIDLEERIYLKNKRKSQKLGVKKKINFKRWFKRDGQ